MAIAINGAGTITGITAGGLPDGVIQGADLASGVGGKVLQVVSVTKVDTFNTTSTSFVAITGLTIDITPTATTSKILVLWNVDTGSAAGYNGAIQLNRDGTPIGGGTAASARPTGQFHHLTPTAATELNSAGTFLDPNTPADTSTAITYNFEGLTEGSTGLYVNRSTADADNTQYVRSSSSITLMEIGA
jgi:hypothetical protein